MKLKMLSATVKPAFLKMFFTKYLYMYLYIFSHTALVLLTFFLFSKLISRTFKYGQVSHYEGTAPLLKKKKKGEKEITKGQTQ